MPQADVAEGASRVRSLLSGGGRWSGCRLTVAIILAIPCSIYGLVVADLAAWASSTECTEGAFLAGLARIALAGVVAGGVPALVAGFRRIALLPFAIASAGPVLIFVAFFFTHGQAADCL